MVNCTCSPTRGVPGFTDLVVTAMSTLGVTKMLAGEPSRSAEAAVSIASGDDKSALLVKVPDNTGRSTAISMVMVVPGGTLVKLQVKELLRRSCRQVGA